MNTLVRRACIGLYAAASIVIPAAFATEPKIEMPRSDARWPLVQPPIPRESLRLHEEGSVGLMLWVETIEQDTRQLVNVGV